MKKENAFTRSPNTPSRYGQDWARNTFTAWRHMIAAIQTNRSRGMGEFVPATRICRTRCAAMPPCQEKSAMLPIRHTVGSGNRASKRTAGRSANAVAIADAIKSILKRSCWSCDQLARSRLRIAATIPEKPAMPTATSTAEDRNESADKAPPNGPGTPLRPTALPRPPEHRRESQEATKPRLERAAGQRTATESTP